jgi:hypothetical protein
VKHIIHIRILQNIVIKMWNACATPSSTTQELLLTVGYCASCICLVLSLSYSDNIKTIPLQLALGTTNDISPLLYFTFYQLVYYHMDDTPFPTDSHEDCGWWDWYQWNCW